MGEPHAGCCLGPSASPAQGHLLRGAEVTVTASDFWRAVGSTAWPESRRPACTLFLPRNPAPSSPGRQPLGLLSTPAAQSPRALHRWLLTGRARQGQAGPGRVRQGQAGSGRAAPPAWQAAARFSLRGLLQIKEARSAFIRFYLCHYDLVRAEAASSPCWTLGRGRAEWREGA